MNLTDDATRRLTPDRGPDGKVYFDDRLPGFGLRVYHSGRKVWLYQFRMVSGGRTFKYEIGSAAALNASQARAQAKIAAGHVARKVNPIEVRRQAEQTHKDIFGEIATDYLHEKLHPVKADRAPMRPRSYAEVERHLKIHCKPFWHRPIHSITQRDVGQLHGDVARNAGTGAASHAWATLRAMMQWAMMRGIIEKNVAALYDGGGAKPARERWLTDAEIAAVWKACNDDDFGRIVRLLLLTGARRDEVGHLPLSEIDLDKATWLLPPERAKNRREHRVPLSDIAVGILLKATEARETFVFGRGSTRGFSGWGRAKEALDKRIADAGTKIEPWTLHDLRRSFASGLQRLRIAPHVIEACLNHLPPKLQRTYQMHDYEDEKRTALDRWAAHIDATVNGAKISNVIDLRSA